MKYINLYESWLRNLIQPAKKPIPKEVYADSFLEGGMQDPMDPKSNYRRIEDSLAYKNARENLPKIIDVSKYYYFDSPYDGRTWLAHFVYHQFKWALEDGIHQFDTPSSSYYDKGGGQAWAEMFYPSPNEKEPVIIITANQGHSDPFQIWIPKFILFKHFQTREDAEKYVNDVKEFSAITKKFPEAFHKKLQGMTWSALKSPEKMAELLGDDLKLLSDFYDLLDPQFLKRLIEIMGLEMDDLESIKDVSDMGLI